MLLRKTANLILALALASVVVAGAASGETAGNKKASMLDRINRMGRSRIAGRATEVVLASPKEAGQLELDLVFYNWASHLSRIPTDVANIDAIIPALAKGLGDDTLTWAVDFFSTAADAKATAAMPPRDDERAQNLFDLKTQFRSAMSYKESDPIKAVDSLQNVSRICQSLSLDISEAMTLKLLGDQFLYNMSRYSQARACYDRAAWTLPIYGCTATSAAVYDDLGTLCTETGEYRNAAENFTKSAQLWEQLARKGPSSFKYRDMAGSEYIKAGGWQIAAGDPVAALELMKTKGIAQLRLWATATKSYDLLIRNLIKVSEFRRGFGGNLESLELLKQAQRACERSSDPILTATVYAELAKTYSALEQPSNKASALAKRAKTLGAATAAGQSALAKLAGVPTPTGASADGLRLTAERGARACQELGSFTTAGEMWQKAAKAYERAGAVDGRIRCLRALATVYEAQQKPMDAINARLQAAMIAREVLQYSLAAEIVQEMTQTFRAANDLQNALEGLTELEDITQSAGNIRGVAQVLEARGTMLAKSGQPEEAARNLEMARTRYLSQIGDLWAAGRVSLDLAAAQIASKKLKRACTTLESTIEEIETNYGFISDGPGTDKDRVNTVKELYKELARAYVHSDQPEAATELVRRGRRYPWLSGLVATLRDDTQDEATRKWAQSLDTSVTEGSSPQMNQPGDRILGDNPGTFLRSCWWIERQYSRDYTALPVRPVDLLKARDQMPEGLVTVEFMPTESASYVFICGKNKAVCRQTSAGREAIDSLVGQLRRTLRDCEERLSAGISIPPVADWQESSFLEIREPLAGLYKLLIEPIEADLEGHQKLAFALPNDLMGLPVHALISSEKNGEPTFLVEDYEISYIASGMLDDVAGKASRAIDPGSDWLAIFADPENNLPGAQAEATEAKNAYLSSRWYVGPDKATATNFLDECTKAGIIHVAAHHRIDSDAMGFQLLLAPDKASDGTVGMQEILGACSSYLQLVVLSACDSVGSADPISSGPAHAAEVFSQAGASAVLGGLWKVSDDAASKIMGDFYRGLYRGKSRSEALQRAQVSVVKSKQFGHPFYWACFALYGNPR